jgi:hypothetical protein
MRLPAHLCHAPACPALTVHEFVKENKVAVIPRTLSTYLSDVALKYIVQCHGHWAHCI